jgi:cell division protein FtsB
MIKEAARRIAQCYEEIREKDAEIERLEAEIKRLNDDRKIGWQIISNMADSMARLGIKDWAPIVKDARLHVERAIEEAK